MVSSYYRNLIKQVLYNSYGDTWEEAVEEWEIIDWEEDKQCNSFCVCGKENIRYLYTIVVQLSRQKSKLFIMN